MENSRILLARRPPYGLLGGMWEFPGGKQEKGETLPACLQREIREELGIQVQVGDAFGVYEHAYTHFRVTLHAFLCKILAGTPQALEAAEIRWVFPDQLNDFPMGKIDRQIALRLQT
jgi:A/G-specific adenine glycosylase